MDNKEEFCHYCELVNELIDRYHENNLSKPIGLPNIMKEDITSNDNELNYYSRITNSSISFSKDNNLVRIVSRKTYCGNYTTSTYEIAYIDGFLVCRSNIRSENSINQYKNSNYLLMGFIGYDCDINSQDIEIQDVVPRRDLYIYEDIINKFEDISEEKILKKNNIKHKIK